MEEEIVQENEFSFKKLFQLLKNSGARIVVFCVITALLCVIASFIVFAVTRSSTETVMTMITFTHEGIEDGEDPFGDSMDVSTIKAPFIISNAVNELSETDNTITADIISDVSSNITIEGVIPTDIAEEMETILEVAETTPSELYKLNDLEYFSSKYVISMTNIESMGLSQASACSLLDEIIIQYMSYFNTTYNLTELVTASAISITNDDLDILTKHGYDYIELYGLYDAQIDTLISYLSEMKVSSSDYRSSTTNLSFSDLSAELDLIANTKLPRLQAYILSNGITSDIAINIAYLELLRTENELLMKAAQEKATAIKDLITQYDNGDYFITSDGNVVTGTGVPTETYNDLFTQQLSYETAAANYSAVIDEIDYKLSFFTDDEGNAQENVNNTQENQLIALNLAISLTNDIESLISEINATASEYYNTEFLSDSIHINIKSTYSSKSSSSVMTMIQLSIFLVVLAGFVAIIVTYIKEKTLIKKLERDKALAETVEE